jgi:hypothetical protein
MPGQSIAATAAICGALDSNSCQVATTAIVASLELNQDQAR